MIQLARAALLCDMNICFHLHSYILYFQELLKREPQNPFTLDLRELRPKVAWI